jgi:hypothetical protein
MFSITEESATLIGLTWGSGKALNSCMEPIRQRLVAQIWKTVRAVLLLIFAITVEVTNIDATNNGNTVSAA